jgi:chromate transport protein ChrA
MLCAGGSTLDVQKGKQMKPLFTGVAVALMAMSFAFVWNMTKAEQWPTDALILAILAVAAAMLANVRKERP